MNHPLLKYILAAGAPVFLAFLCSSTTLADQTDSADEASNSSHASSPLSDVVIPEGIPVAEIPVFREGRQRENLIRKLHEAIRNSCLGTSPREIASLVHKITVRQSIDEGGQLTNLVLTENALSLNQVSSIIVALSGYGDGVKWLRMISKYSIKIASRIYDMYLEQGGGHPNDEPEPHIASIATTLLLAVVDSSLLGKGDGFVELLKELEASPNRIVARAASGALVRRVSSP